MLDDDYIVLETMESYGGSFVKCLAKLFRLADPQNYIKLKVAFAEYWEEYEEMAKYVR